MNEPTNLPRCQAVIDFDPSPYPTEAPTLCGNDLPCAEHPAVSPTSERQRDEESMDEAILRLEAARAALPTPTEAHWRIYYELKHAIEFLRAYEAQRREIKE